MHVVPFSIELYLLALTTYHIMEGLAHLSFMPYIMKTFITLTRTWQLFHTIYMITN